MASPELGRATCTLYTWLVTDSNACLASSSWAASTSLYCTLWPTRGAAASGRGAGGAARGGRNACWPGAPVASLDAAGQQVDRMRSVIRVDKLLQRGLGLLRRNAILLCIPAEGYQLVACKRVGQLRRSHGHE